MAARLPLGLGFMGLGGFMVWGGVTGRLAPMLAAVFAPSLLEPAQSAGGGFPLLDINPPKGGELTPVGSGPGADGPPLASLPGEPAPTAIGSGSAGAIGSGGPVIDILPAP